MFSHLSKFRSCLKMNIKNRMSQLGLFLSSMAGFNVETVAYKNVNFVAWDVGGRDKIVSLVYCQSVYAGFNVETINYKGINFTTWDVSGRDKIVSVRVIP